MCEKTIKVTQIKSSNGRLKVHRDCLRGLGLRGINSSVTLFLTRENLGMIKRVGFMLRLEDQ